ncbi:MAG: hypothetical protein V7K90_21905 [Nostoc sp.]|uniref:hypothetical protein n=1 Tax=Nostoc sp. TaxID=1180 RepID=UPI002FFBA4C5
MSNNQSILQDFGLVEELDEEAGETITGGAEVFTIKNKTPYDITYILDGKSWLHRPNETWIWTAYSGGIIKFDKDSRNNYVDNQSYNLADGRIYEFQDKTSTPGNPFDIELYSVA